MKTKVYRVGWLFPVLGIALSGGSYYVTKSYFGYEQEIRSAEYFMAVCDRLIDDCQLTRMLMQAQNDGCAGTARSLDESLSTSMESINSEVASADTRTRVIAGACLKYIDRRRAQNAVMGAGVPAGRSGLSPVAPGVLAQTAASSSPGK